MSLFRLMFLLFLPEQRLVFLFLCGVHCDISLFTASSRPSLSFLSCLNLSPSSHPLSSASSSLFTMFFFPSFILTTTLSLISLCLVPFDFQVGNWKSYFTFHPLFSFALSFLCVYILSTSIFYFNLYLLYYRKTHLLCSLPEHCVRSLPLFLSWNNWSRTHHNQQSCNITITRIGEDLIR